MRFGVKIEKKFAFMIIGAILVLAGAIYAYAQDSAVFGHDFEEIAFPAGTIMAFNLPDCPGGWNKLAAADGRTIIGTGGPYVLGQTGGTARHTLTKAEMPSHSHNQNRLTYTAGPGWGADNSAARDTTVPTSTTGGGQSHNNMQPYIAYLYCVKD